MKKIVNITLVLLTIILMTPFSGLADRGGRGGHGGHVGVGISVGPVWGPWWWGSSYYPYSPYPYPYYSAPPVVIQQPEPEIYVAPESEVQEPSYWYYCQDPKGYFPYVKQCPNGWMKVVPSPPPPPGKELPK